MVNDDSNRSFLWHFLTYNPNYNHPHDVGNKYETADNICAGSAMYKYSDHE